MSTATNYFLEDRHPPIPPELILDHAPNAYPAACDVCESAGADYTDKYGSHICQACVDDHPDQALGLVKYEPWEIRSLQEAEWAMAKYTEAKTKADEVRALAAGYRARIAKWEAEALAVPDDDAAFFEGHLQAYAAGVREANPRAKTVKLAGGRVKSQALNPRPVVEDQAAVVAFLEHYAAEMGEDLDKLVRVTKAPVMAGLKSILLPEGIEVGQAVVLDGTEVPGVAIEPASVKFAVVPE